MKSGNACKRFDRFAPGTFDRTYLAIVPSADRSPTSLISPESFVAARELAPRFPYRPDPCRWEFAGLIQFQPQLLAALVERFGVRPILEPGRRLSVLLGHACIEPRRAGQSVR